MEFIAEYMSSQYNDNKQQKQTEKASTGQGDTAPKIPAVSIHVGHNRTIRYFQNNLSTMDWRYSSFDVDDDHFYVNRAREIA